MKVTESQIPEIVTMVRKRLSTLSAERKANLELDNQDYHLEDEWLYLCVASKSPKVRASEYAELLAEIEKELHSKEIDNVLLVPVIAD